MNLLLRALAIFATATVLAAACGTQRQPEAADDGDPGVAAGPVVTIAPATPAPDEGASAQGPAAGEAQAPPALPEGEPAPTVPVPPWEPVVVTDDPTPVPTPSPTPEPLVCEPAEVDGELVETVPVDTDGDGELDGCVTFFGLNLATPEPTAEPEPLPQPTALVVPLGPDPVKMAAAAEASPWVKFDDDVYSWSGWEVVVHEVPVSGEAVEELRWLTGAFDAPIADNDESRRWLQECVDRYLERAVAHRASFGVEPYEPTYHGEATAAAVQKCTGSLLRLGQLTARYVWDPPGRACVAELLTKWALEGDAAGLPLAECASVGYDPKLPRPEGWLAARCDAIVAAIPNPDYPTDPHASYLVGEPLPSCWDDLVGVIEAHAASGVARGNPFRPHDCFHAFLSFVVARQSGLESRSPFDLSIGCNYSVAEAIP